MEDKYGVPATILPEIDEEEIWAPAPGFEDRYEISSFGNLRHKRTGRLRKLDRDHFGYPVVSLRKPDADGKYKKVCCIYIHRLVCEAFNGAPTEEYNVCDHIDHCIVNNYYRNLRFTNHRGNKLNTNKLGKKHLTLNKTPIVFLNSNGDLIQRFGNIVEAHNGTGISITQIFHNLRGSREPFKGGCYFKTEADYFDK